MTPSKMTKQAQATCRKLKGINSLVLWRFSFVPFFFFIVVKYTERKISPLMFLNRESFVP